MFGLKILFWIFAIMLLLITVSSLCASTSKDRVANDRYTDLVIGVVTFALFVVLFLVFGKYIVW